MKTNIKFFFLFIITIILSNFNCKILSLNQLKSEDAQEIIIKALFGNEQPQFEAGRLDPPSFFGKKKSPDYSIDKSRPKGGFWVESVKKEGSSYIARTEIKKGQYILLFKLNKYGTEWKVDEVKKDGVLISIGEAKNWLLRTFHGDFIKWTMGDLKSIGSAVECYMTDNYRAPVGRSIHEIRSKLEPFYIKKLPLKDAWGNDFYYHHGTGKNQDIYFIASYGSDGKFNGFNQKGIYYASPNDGRDIIFSNGYFPYAPKMR